jgi:putative flippase GtrA
VTAEAEAGPSRHNPDGAAGRDGAHGAGARAGGRRTGRPSSLQARYGIHVRQFVKFSLVGGSGVFVNLAVFNATLLTWQLVTGHMGLTASYVANGLGFVVSVITNYYLNRRWTFRSTGNVTIEFSKFVAVSLVAYGVNLGIFTIAHTVFDLRGNVSQLIAIACVMPVNFLANKLWSFRQR